MPSTNDKMPKRSKKDTEPREIRSNKRKAAVVIHQNEGTEQADDSVFDFPNDEGEFSQLPESSDQPPAKKRRGDDGKANGVGGTKGNELETSKPSALFTPRKGRKWTLTIAIPGSVIANVAKPDQKTLLAGRFARMAAVFCVDEIVVYDDDPLNIPDYVDRKYRGTNRTKKEVQAAIEPNDEPWQDPDQFLTHVLAYTECPPHLRNDIFGLHPNLKWAGTLPSLDMPHHLKSHEWCRYREGITVGPPVNALHSTPKGNNKKRKSKGPAEEETQQQWTYVKCGLPFPVKVPFAIGSTQRVTLRFASKNPPPSWPHLSKQECEELPVNAVDSHLPREEAGYYWGYNVRRATSLSDVHISCDYPDGYDWGIGTSERGVPLESVLPDAVAPYSRTRGPEEQMLPNKFKHLCIFFGGVAGLEPAVAADPEFSAKGLTKENASEAFDSWVNLVQGQGSRTIRTEEAVEFGLYGLKGYVDSQYGA